MTDTEPAATLGTAYIVSAPSGAGKTTLIHILLDRLDHVAMSVSHTTRPPRPGEEDGRDYHFVDHRTFERMLAEGDFLEYAKVFDNYYGTSRSALMAQLRSGVDVILDVDWQGARQIREALPDTISVFVLPPSLEALEQRLRARGQDPEEVISRRMREAVAQMSHYGEYDYLIVNDELDPAAEGLISIVRAGRLRQRVQAVRHGDLLARLLQQ